MLRKSIKLFTEIYIFLFIFTSVSFAHDAPTNLTIKQGGQSYTTVGKWFNNPLIPLTFWMNKPINDVHLPETYATGINLFIYNLDNGALITVPPTIADSNDNASVDQTLTNGRYRWEAESFSTAGTSPRVYFGSSASTEMDFGIDDIAPTNSTISSSFISGSWLRGASPQISFTNASDSLSGIDGYAYALSTDVNYSLAASKMIEQNVTGIIFSNLINGAKYYFFIRTLDNAGNWSTQSKQGPYVADSIAPDTSITSGPTGPVNSKQASFSFSGTDNLTKASNLTYSYKLDKGSWSAYSIGTTTTYNKLSSGIHTFYVRAKDSAGNVDSTPAFRTFSAYVAPPALKIILFTKLSLSVKPKAITQGQAVVVKGQLRDVKGKPLANKAVVIKANGKRVKKVLTNAKGSFQFKHKPKKNTVYKASFGGNSSLSASNSNLAKVKVKKAKKKLKKKAKAKKKKKKK